MSLRRFARTAILVMLALAVIVPQAAAAPKPKPAPTPTPPPTPTSSPSAPTNLRITASTSASVTLTWDAPKSDTALMYYFISESGFKHHFVDPSQTTFTRTRLAPNVPYSWVVRAVDMNVRASADSNRVTYTTPPDTTPPPAPTLSEPLYVGPRLVELDWTDSVDETNSATTYLVNRNGSSTNYGNVSRAVVPLAPSTTNSISITARDNSGNTATSNTISVTTPAADNTSPPSPPPNFIAQEVGGCEGWLSWGASMDDVDPPSVIRYEAFVNGILDHSAFGLRSAIIYATQNGTNTYSVVAIDSSGNRSQPSVADVPNMWLC
jgi:Fibronectin type III domain